MVSHAGIWRTLKISKQKAGSGEHINWGATAGEAEHVGLTGTASHSVDRAPERIRCLLKDCISATVTSFIATLSCGHMIGCRSVTSGLLCLVDTNLRQRVQIRKDTTFILLIFFLFIYLLFGHTPWPMGSHFPDSDQTWAPCSENTDSQSLDHWGSPYILFFFFLNPV